MSAENREMDSRIQWPPLLRLMAVSSALFCSMAVVTPTLGELLNSRFGSNSAASAFMLAHSLPQVLLLGLVVGAFSDRLGRRVPLAILGAFGTGITTILIPFMATYQGLLTLRFLDGLLGIAGIGMVLTRAVDLARGAARSQIMGLFMISVPVGYLCGSLLTTAVGLAGGSLTVVYAFAGAAVCLSALLLIWDLPKAENIESREPGLGAMLSAFRRVPKLWVPILFGAVDKFSFALLAMLPSLITQEQFGLTGFAAPGAVMVGFWVAFALASVPVGQLVARYGPWRMVAAGGAGYGVCLAVALAFHSPWLFLVSIALAGAFTALRFTPNMLLVGQLARADEKGTAVAAFNLAGSYALILGFILVGLGAKHAGYLATFAIVGAMEIACAAFAWHISNQPSNKVSALVAIPAEERPALPALTVSPSNH